MPWDKLEQGTEVKLKQCSLKVNLFQLSVHPNRTDYVITNDKAICTSEDATKACGFRWKIEQYHREVKQTTGIAKCQARNSKAQRKHIITSILSWIVMHAQAISRKITIYQLKNEPLEAFQRNIWRNPYTAFST